MKQIQTHRAIGMYKLMQRIGDWKAKPMTGKLKSITISSAVAMLLTCTFFVRAQTKSPPILIRPTPTTISVKPFRIPSTKPGEEMLVPASEAKGKKIVPATKEEAAAAIVDAKAASDEVGKKLHIEFGTIETNHFLIFTDWDKREYNFLKNNLEAAYEAVSRQFEIPVANNVFIGKLPVYMFATQEGFMKFAEVIDESPVPRTVLGYYSHSTSGFGHMTMWKPDVAANEGNVKVAERKWAYTLTHEFTHAFVARYRTTGFIPRWLNEGIAEFVANNKFPDLDVRDYVKNSSSRRNDIQDIFEPRYRLVGRDYPVALTMVETMVNGNGKEFLPYFQDLKDGMKPDEALLKHYKVTSKGLETAWRKYIKTMKN